MQFSWVKNIENGCNKKKPKHVFLWALIVVPLFVLDPSTIWVLPERLKWSFSLTLYTTQSTVQWIYWTTNLHARSRDAGKKWAHTTRCRASGVDGAIGASTWHHWFGSYGLATELCHLPLQFALPYTWLTTRDARTSCAIYPSCLPGVALGGVRFFFLLHALFIAHFPCHLPILGAS